MKNTLNIIRSKLKADTGLTWAVRAAGQSIRITAPAARLTPARRLRSADALKLAAAFNLPPVADFDYLTFSASEIADYLAGSSAGSSAGSDAGHIEAAKEVRTLDFLKTKFEVRKTGRVWREIVGADEMPGRLFAAMYGLPSSGKSTLAIQMADDETFSRPLLVAAEEGFSQSVRDRIQRVGAKKLVITNEKEFDKVIQSVKDNKYDLVVLDTVTVLKVEPKDIEKLLRAGASVLAILQSRKDGDFKGGQDWFHNSALFLEVEDMRWRVTKSWFSVLNSGRVDMASGKVEKTAGVSYVFKEMLVDDLHIDARRFQYKLGVDASGVIKTMDRKFNLDYYSPISVWQDASGKALVVNGHHRVAWAKASGVKWLPVRIIPAADAVEARSIGALQNMAEGQGTATDAAKFMRDTGKRADDLAAQGIPLKRSKLFDALGLVGLSDTLFDEVARGILSEKEGAIIGGAKLTAEQEKTVRARMKMIGDLSLEKLRTLVQDVADAPIIGKEETGGLFGAETWNESAYEEWLTVCAGIRSALKGRKRALSVAGKYKEIIETVDGNNIDGDATAEESKDANVVVTWFDNRRRQSPVYEICRDAAQKLAEKKASQSAIITDATKRVLDAFESYMRGNGESPIQGSPAAVESPKRESEDFVSDLCPVDPFVVDKNDRENAFNVWLSNIDDIISKKGWNRIGIKLSSKSMSRYVSYGKNNRVITIRLSNHSRSNIEYKGKDIDIRPITTKKEFSKSVDLAIEYALSDKYFNPFSDESSPVAPVAADPVKPSPVAPVADSTLGERVQRFEDKKQARIDRMRTRAEKKREKAQQVFDESRKITEMIPMGQPILVGHHSEKRHRNALDRSWNKWGKSVALSKEAEELERRAQSAENNDAIDSGDPLAVEKLKDRVAELESLQDMYKAVNKIAKKKGVGNADKKAQIMKQFPQIAEKEVDYILNPPYAYQRQGFQPFTLQNNLANIARVKERIKILSRGEKMVDEVTIGDIRIENDKDEFRTKIYFPDIPSFEIRTKLKRNGFHWARGNRAWQRKMSESAFYQAKVIVEEAVKSVTTV